MPMNSPRLSPLTRVFSRPFVVWGIAALIAGLASSWTLKHQALQPFARLAIGLLPILPAIMFVIAFVTDVRKLDEMQRRMHMQAAAISFLLTVILTFVFDGLKSAGIYTATLSDLDTATILIWVGTLAALSLKYR